MEKTAQLLKNLNEDRWLEYKNSATKWGKHPDWPWNGVLLSAATLGGSTRWKKHVAPRYDSHFSWAALEGTTEKERAARFDSVGRYRKKTASSLMKIHKYMHDKGGPVAVRRELEQLSAEEVIAFWKDFDGFGDKYARNIMMDVYDARFRHDRFAIDSRITGLLRHLGYAGGKSYGEQETFLAGLARAAGMEGWELDRLLYNEAGMIEDRLGASAGERNGAISRAIPELAVS